MMKNTFSLILIVFLFSCSDDENELADDICKTNSEALLFDNTYVYTGEMYSIEGSKFCKSDSLSILLGNTKVKLTDVQDTKIFFEVPQLSSDSVSIKVNVADEIINLNKKVAVFPGNGTWKSVAPFPGSARSHGQSMVTNGKGYFSGGSKYIDWESGHEYYNDLYEYNEATNTWVFIDSNDQFLDKASGTATNGELFLFPTKVYGAVSTYQIDSKSVATTYSYSSNSTGKIPFSSGEDTYVCLVEGTQEIRIKKFNPATETWDVVTALSYTEDANPMMNFAFVYNNLAYVGYNFLNNKTLTLQSYNFNTNQLVEVSNIEIATHTVGLIKHLFTIDNIAYFIEVGESSIETEGTSIHAPADKLYMYNFKTEDWKIVTHEFPETFFNIASFTLNNRGFAGLSQNPGSPGFNYSQKFYEFIPH